MFAVIWEIYYKRSYEMMRSFRRPGGIVIDCGAHIGLYSLKIAKFSQKVISIEPERRNFHYLILNIRLNKLVERILPLKFAISDKKGFALLFKTKYSGIHSIIHVDNYIETEEIKTISLDILIRKLKLDNVEILKLDVEGAELLALRGLKNEAVKVKNIVLEVHTKIVKINDIIRELNSMNFAIIKIYKIPGIRDSVIVYATHL
jgi:FkbM family methyltransferase